MKIQKGDIVFGPQGSPGIVMDREQKTGFLKVDTQNEAYQTARKFGFVNGMRPQEREVFQKVMSDVQESQSPMQRLDMIGAAIEELEKDPNNLQIVRYLQSEKAHIMFSSGIGPRTYTIDESKL